MRDRRLPPFVWQEVAALAVIREHFAGRERVAALAVYVSLTDAANDARVRDGFEVPRSDLASRAGVSRDTLDRYLKAFAGLGLLEVEQQHHGNVQLPNLYTLTSPSRRAGGGRTPGAGVAARDGQGVAARQGQSLTKKRSKKGEAPPGPPEGGTAPAPPERPVGIRKRDTARYEQAVLDYAADVGVTGPRQKVLTAYEQARVVDPPPGLVKATSDHGFRPGVDGPSAYFRAFCRAYFHDVLTITERSTQEVP